MLKLTSRYNSENFQTRAFNSLIASFVVNTIMFPLEKCKFLIQTNQSVWITFKRNGIRDFYTGVTRNWLKMIAGSVTFLPIYSSFNERGYSTFQSSLISAAISTTISHPFDFLRTWAMAGRKFRDIPSPRFLLEDYWQIWLE